MEIEYKHPGTIRIDLGLDDYLAMSDRGFVVERAGFHGSESKTWVHKNSSSEALSTYPSVGRADIESGGDLHVRLNGPRNGILTLEQSSIRSDPKLTEHYLGRTGVILVTFDLPM